MNSHPLIAASIAAILLSACASTPRSPAGYVMDDRGADNEPATPDDIAQMAALVGEAIRAGALGFSTNRLPMHTARDGRPVPGTYASRHELPEH